MQWHIPQVVTAKIQQFFTRICSYLHWCVIKALFLWKQNVLVYIFIQVQCFLAPCPFFLTARLSLLKKKKMVNSEKKSVLDDLTAFNPYFAIFMHTYIRTSIHTHAQFQSSVKSNKLIILLYLLAKVKGGLFLMHLAF